MPSLDGTGLGLDVDRRAEEDGEQRTRRAARAYRAPGRLDLRMARALREPDRLGPAHEHVVLDRTAEHDAIRRVELPGELLAESDLDEISGAYGDRRLVGGGRDHDRAGRGRRRVGAGCGGGATAASQHECDAEQVLHDSSDVADDVPVPTTPRLTSGDHKPFLFARPR